MFWLSSSPHWQKWLSLPCVYHSVFRHVGGSVDLVLSLLEHCFLYKVSDFSTALWVQENDSYYLRRDEGLEQQSHRKGILLGQQEAASVFGFQWSPPPWSSQDCIFHGWGYILGLRRGSEWAWVPSLRAQWPLACLSLLSGIMLRSSTLKSWQLKDCIGLQKRRLSGGWR